MVSLLYLSPILSFLTTLIAIPVFIRYLNRINLLVKDQNKENKPLVPISGGITVVAGILIGLMCYIFILTFVYKDLTQISIIFAVASTMLLITFIGFLFYINSGGIHETKTIGALVFRMILTLIFIISAYFVIIKNFGY